ncbi:MAG: sorbosone dehydrogenase family protein [Pseudomonadota bacterium]|nr:sorbosone dehydrogenase family protein [Pseudomonadota bacterium]
MGALAGAGTVGSWAASADSAAEYGPRPVIPEPEKSLIPTLHIAKAAGWKEGSTPRAAPGTAVTAFAAGLSHPRWLYVLPNGDVLVAEAEAPPKPDDAKGVSGRVHKLVMQRAGSGAHPSANRITLLRQAQPGGPAVERHIFLQGLNSPIGMALIGDAFYVADSDAVLRFPYRTGETEIRAQPVKVAALPAGSINHHWTKSLIASPDGRKLFVGVGSNSNAAENGLDAEYERAAVWEIDPKSGGHRLFASGLRNPVGLAWEPESGALWVAVNERDELGDHVPPDYMTALHDGAFYGWPFSYYGQHVDDRVKPQNPELVAKAIPPDYALGAHTASLGLCWSDGSSLPAFQHGMFVGQHGSWNRKDYSGYKVVFVPFAHGMPAGAPVEVLGGFLDADHRALGRPVGVAMDKRGALLVADDVGNVIWRVTPAEHAPPAASGQGVAEDEATRSPSAAP